VSERRLRDDEVDRLLRAALPDDLPAGLEETLRRDVRDAWRRAASAPAHPGRRLWLGLRGGWSTLLPQPALVAAALAMLAAGAVMQAAPAPRDVVESLLGRQASAAAARALADARAMRCTVEVADERGRLLTYRIDWTAPGAVRVRLDRAGEVEERTLRAPGPAPSVLTRTGVTPDVAPRDPELEPARACLSPSALGERLGAPWRPAPGDGGETFVVASGPRGPGLTVRVDTATHLPLRLDGTDRDGRKQAAVCRWP
jgi:hypothetical protein